MQIKKKLAVVEVLSLFIALNLGLSTNSYETFLPAFMPFSLKFPMLAAYSLQTD